MKVNMLIFESVNMCKIYTNVPHSLDESGLIRWIL